MRIFQEETIIPTKRVKLGLKELTIGNLIKPLNEIDYFIQHYKPGDTEGNPSCKYTQTQDSWVFELADLIRNNPEIKVENVPGVQLKYVNSFSQEGSYVEVTAKASDSRLEALIRGHKDELYKKTTKFLMDKFLKLNTKNKTTIYFP